MKAKQNPQDNKNKQKPKTTHPTQQKNREGITILVSH